MFREAWTLGLNLHMLYVTSCAVRASGARSRSAAGWAASAPGSSRRALPFWSKVMKLTIHERTAIDPTSADPSRQPVTGIDVALSEGVVRKLSIAMDAVPGTEAEATAFLNAKATAAERAAATTVATERDLLMRLVLRERVGSITGSVDRDFRMATRMGTVGGTFREILRRARRRTSPTSARAPRSARVLVELGDAARRPRAASRPPAPSGAPPMT